MRLLTAMLLLAAAPSMAQQEAVWELYHAPGADTAALSRQVQPLLPADTALQLHALTDKISGKQDAEQHARAIAAGVNSLPCLVLRDTKGAYTALPLPKLNAASIAQARQGSETPEQQAAARYRRILAHLYLQRYLLSIATEASEQDRIIDGLQQLSEHPDAPEELRQFIGLHCIYPALMQQYATEYRGAHTPRTEAKLLSAIRALETVRDTNPNSGLGRRAYDEREKLRAARLKSRQYE